MHKISKVVLIQNAVETLGYFSEQIALELKENGFELYLIDYDALYETVGKLNHFLDGERAALITFNNIGLGEEAIFRDATGQLVWERYEMRIINILVDHPLYYHKFLLHSPLRTTFFCVDKEHVTYVKRFYPGIKVKFMPLAGNIRLGIGASNMEPIPYDMRKYDIVFTANYVPLEDLERHIQSVDHGYQVFYRGIIDDLIENPTQSVDVVMERHIRNELGDVPSGDIRAAMSGMLLIDLYVRTYMRAKIVQELVDSDIKLHVFGAGWERLQCKKAHNLIRNGGQVSSRICVEAIRNAKIALNVMPWFKAGSHDRVFTAMLQKTVAFTDASKYMHKEFTDGEELVFYSLENRKYMPELVEMILRDESGAYQIAEKGYEKAIKAHTWRNRTRQIIMELQQEF